MRPWWTWRIHLSSAGAGGRVDECILGLGVISGGATHCDILTWHWNYGLGVRRNLGLLLLAPTTCLGGRRGGGGGVR